MRTQLLKAQPCGHQKRQTSASAVSHHGSHRSLLRAKHQLHSETAFKRGNRHLIAKEAMKAISCYQLAANAGHAGAQYNLGLMYLKGEGIPRDALNGLEWIAKAANNGDKKAHELLQRIDQALVGR
ncbi:MAG: tetratricopeptide repeat protein [Acidiferrobacterales bacterium]